MSSSTAHHVALAGSYDLAGCAALRSQLLETGEEAAGGAVHLDLSAVTDGDVGFVQLLLSFEVSLGAAGRELSASGSQAVRDLFERTGASLPGLA